VKLRRDISQANFKSIPRLILPDISDFSGGDDQIYSAKHLELAHCLMSKDDLKRFTGNFPDLKTLRLEISHHTLSRFRSDTVNSIPQLGEA
jgi:hypothetical protein